jgi:hypothetical protein
MREEEGGCCYFRNAGLKNKREISDVYYLTEKNTFHYIYEVITSQEKGKHFTNFGRARPASRGTRLVPLGQQQLNVLGKKSQSRGRPRCPKEPHQYCLLLHDLLQSCSRGGRGGGRDREREERVEDMCLCMRPCVCIHFAPGC